MFSLAGKNALVIGIANEDSIAFGCARAFRDQGANLAVTYQNDKAEKYIRPLAEELGTDILLPLDVREDAQYDQLFDRIRQLWGHVDICLHSIAFCPKDDLHARVVNCSRNGFITAMDISVYSFIRMVRRAADATGRHLHDGVLSRRRQGRRALQHHGTCPRPRSSRRPATWLPISAPRASASTPSRPDLSKRGPRRAFPILTN